MIKPQAIDLCSGPKSLSHTPRPDSAAQASQKPPMPKSPLSGRCRDESPLQSSFNGERPAVARVKIVLKVKIVFGLQPDRDQKFDLWISFLTPNESKVVSRQTLSGRAALQFDRAKFRSVGLVPAGDACQAVAGRCMPSERHTHEPPPIIDLTLLSDAT